MNEETTDDVMDHDQNKNLGVVDPSELNFDTGNAVCSVRYGIFM